MRPSEQLEGMKLADGWTVLKRLQRGRTSTGGENSAQYIVENVDGRKGFLKAMDYTEALKAPDTAEFMQALTRAYLFEKSICEKCKKKGLRRVLHAIASGSVNPHPEEFATKVEYLVFELADHGDIRSHLDAHADLDLAFLLRAIHHVAVGLSELHRTQIAHQDLKPSNVLVFEPAVGTKISDLGRAWDQQVPSPFDSCPVAGDRTYAPPERLYGQPLSQEPYARFASDIYQLGSLIVFLFARVHVNAALVRSLAPEHRPISWGDTYVEVLPYLQATFGRIVADFSLSVPVLIRSELAEIVKYLCEPDPARRGHPANRRGRGNPYSLERTISTLALLCSRASSRLFRA